MVRRCVGCFSPRPKDLDDRGREAGRIFVRYWPPGQHEIHDFGFRRTMIVAGGGAVFAVAAVDTVHDQAGGSGPVGNFASGPSLGTQLEPDLGAAGCFVVSDPFERDLPIARVKAADLPPVRIEVDGVSTLGHPMFCTAIEDLRGVCKNARFAPARRQAATAASIKSSIAAP